MSCSNFKLAIRLVCIALLFATGPVLSGELVLVVSSQSTIQSMDKNVLMDLYLGRQLTHRIRVGDVVTLPYRSAFYHRLTGRDIRQVESLWAQRLFTAEGLPPEMFRRIDNALTWVRQEPDRVLYLEAKDLTDDLKVIYELGE